MNNELAELMTRSELERDRKTSPDRYDFSYHVQHAGGTYNIIWEKDINVSNPLWHIRWEVVG